jgi:putative transposase
VRRHLKMSRPPRIPNWLPWGVGTIYFVTFCIHPRSPALANASAWAVCRSALSKLNQWRVLFAIAMPDHLHLLVAPADRDASVSQFAKWFKRWFNEAYRATGAVQNWKWQEGCFDRLLRSDESLTEKWNYLEQNPVRAGLVRDVEDWPYVFRCDNDGV